MLRRRASAECRDERDGRAVRDVVWVGLAVIAAIALVVVVWELLASALGGSRVLDR